MTTTLIRFATPDDVSLLLQLIRELAAYERVPDAVVATDLHAAWSSPESRVDIRRLSVETAMLYLTNGHLRNLVNGFCLPSVRR